MKSLLFFSIFMFSFYLLKAQSFGDTLNLVANNSSCTLKLYVETNHGNPVPSCSLTCSNILTIAPFQTGWLIMGCPNEKVTLLRLYDPNVPPGSATLTICASPAPWSNSFSSTCAGSNLVTFSAAVS